MRISPISFTTFTGKEVPYITKLGENGLKSLPDFYPASSVEKTLGSHHSFEKIGWSEPDIVKLFYVVGFILGAISIIYGVWI